MKLSVSLWYTSMRPDFVVGDEKLWSISSLICSNSSSVIFLNRIMK